MDSGEAYVIFPGRIPGVYKEWEACSKQVAGFRYNSFKKHPNYDLALQAWRIFQRATKDNMPPEDVYAVIAPPPPTKAFTSQKRGQRTYRLRNKGILGDEVRGGYRGVLTNVDGDWVAGYYGYIVIAKNLEPTLKRLCYGLNMVACQKEEGVWVEIKTLEAIDAIKNVYDATTQIIDTHF